MERLCAHRSLTPTPRRRFARAPATPHSCRHHADAQVRLRTVDITTVADDLIVLHDGEQGHRYDGLSPQTEYDLLGRMNSTLPRPGGELLCRIATVNDVHFGEV